MRRLSVVAVAAMVAITACGGTSRPAPRPTDPPPIRISAPAPRAVEAPEPERFALPPVTPDRVATRPQTITVDHTIDLAEWEDAGLFVVPDHDLIQAVGFTFDDNHLFLRVDFVRDLLGDDRTGWDLYIEVPNAAAKGRRSLLGHELGFSASHLVSWRGSDPLALVGPRPLETADSPIPGVAVGFDGRSQVVELPLDVLGSVLDGDWIRFRFVDRTGGREGSFTSDGPMEAPLPAQLTQRPCPYRGSPCGAGPS